MNAISVKNLNKVFTYYEKKEGFQHSLKNLLVRKQKTKEAVKNISFDIDRVFRSKWSREDNNIKNVEWNFISD